MYCGLVGPDGSLRLYDGNLRFVGPDGSIVADQVAPDDYATYIGEATLPDSYLKAPYYKPVGYPDGIYRVGPLARLNVADRCGTPQADAELEEYRGRFGRIVQSGFHYHYARLIEALYALERMQELLDDPAILGTMVRAHAGVNDLEGVGVIEAPRGTLIHHYKVDANGAMTWANLIVATGHNNLAIGRGILQVAKRFVDGNKIRKAPSTASRPWSVPTTPASAAPRTPSAWSRWPCSCEGRMVSCSTRSERSSPGGSPPAPPTLRPSPPRPPAPLPSPRRRREGARPGARRGPAPRPPPSPPPGHPPAPPLGGGAVPFRLSSGGTPKTPNGGGPKGRNAVAVPWAADSGRGKAGPRGPASGSASCWRAAQLQPLVEPQLRHL